MTALPSAVILGGRVNALSAVRSLGRRAVDVTVLDHGNEAWLAGRSKHCARYVEGPAGVPTSKWWLRWLEEHAHGQVLIPCNDIALELIASNYSALGGRGLVPILLDSDASLTALDKEATYARARAVGLPVPSTCELHEPGDIQRAFELLGLPCAIKPLSSHRFWEALEKAPTELSEWKRHAKGAVFHDATTLRAVAGRLVSAGVPALATEIVPGPDSGFCSYYTYVDEYGEPRVHFTKCKPRQYPIHFGDGTFHETKWQPDVVAAGLAVLQAIGAKGICNVEFKRRHGGEELVLIECNLRLTASDVLERRAGLDLAWIAYQAARGIDEPVPASFVDGLYQWVPRADWRAYRSYREARELTTGKWLRSLAHRHALPVFDARDPAPTGALILRRTRNTPKRVVRKLGLRQGGGRAEALPPAHSHPTDAPGSDSEAPVSR